MKSNSSLEVTCICGELYKNQLAEAINGLRRLENQTLDGVDVSEIIKETFQKIEQAGKVYMPRAEVKKICDDPDYCSFADCPTAFCDRNKPVCGGSETHEIIGHLEMALICSLAESDIPDSSWRNEAGLAIRKYWEARHNTETHIAAMI